MVDIKSGMVRCNMDQAMGYGLLFQGAIVTHARYVGHQRKIVVVVGKERSVQLSGLLCDIDMAVYYIGDLPDLETREVSKMYKMHQPVNILLSDSGSDSFVDGKISNLTTEEMGCFEIFYEANVHLGAMVCTVDGTCVGIVVRWEPISKIAVVVSAKRMARELEYVNQRNTSEVCFKCNKMENTSASSPTLLNTPCNQCSVLAFGTNGNSEPIEGISLIIEKTIMSLEYNIWEARQGPFEWKIRKGSSEITIGYHQKSGHIIAEVLVCEFPDIYNSELFEFLLSENQKLECISFSIRDNHIMMSMVLNDQYITDFIVGKYVKNLLKISDAYDDILIKKYGCFKQ